MQAHVMYNIATDMFDLWLTETVYGQSRFLEAAGNGLFRLEPRKEHEPAPRPFLSMPSQAWLQLSQELKRVGLAPKDDADAPATVKRLADVIAVRDRLLAIVEKVVGS